MTASHDVEGGVKQVIFETAYGIPSWYGSGDSHNFISHFKVTNVFT